MDEPTVPSCWEERASSVSSQGSLATSSAEPTPLPTLPTPATGGEPVAEELASSGGEGSSFTVVGARRRRQSSSAASEEGRGRPGVTEMVLGRTDVAYLLSSRNILQVKAGFQITQIGPVSQLFKVESSKTRTQARWKRSPGRG